MLEGDELAAWLRARAGKLTASRMAVAMSFKRDGTPTEQRSKLMRELLAERITGDSVRHFVTDAMQWGLEKECDAKAAYEAETGILIAEAGFYDHPRIDMFGATPDGLIGRDGIIETKCPTTPTFVDWCLAGVVPVEHRAQMCAQLACCGRRVATFVAYDPRIRDPRRQLLVRQFEPPREEIERIEEAAVKFLDELDVLFEAFTTQAA